MISSPKQIQNTYKQQNKPNKYILFLDFNSIIDRQLKHKIPKNMQSNNQTTPLPIQIATPQTRVCTDWICTIISALFAITMFVAANIMWNKNSFQNHFASYYGINDGGLCNGNSLFFPNPTDTTNYQCVTTCPTGFFDQGKLCVPADNAQFENYMDNHEISVLVVGQYFKWVLLYTAIIAFCLGILRLVYVNCIPRLSVKIDFFGSLFLLIAIAILLLLLYDIFWHGVTLLKLGVVIVCFLIALIVFMMLCMYSNQLKLQGIFLDYAVQYLNENICIYFYIPVFLCLAVGLIALFLWQHCCFASRRATSRDFFNFNNDGIWGVFNILEFIWGTQFLRDAFNLCVSGNVTDHYWNTIDNGNCYSPYKRLLCKHWGSVVWGSFLNAFFQIPSMIISILTCYPGTCCPRAGEACSKYNILANLFHLVRTDAYSYINITSSSYCVSSSRCKQLCQNSALFVGYRSPMKHNRFTAHVFSISIVFIMAWFIQKDQLEYYGIWNFALLIMLPLLILTWFISIYTDAAQAFQTCFLIEHETQPNYQLMQHLHHEFKDDLQHREKKVKKDGHC